MIKKIKCVFAGFYFLKVEPAIMRYIEKKKKL